MRTRTEELRRIKEEDTKDCYSDDSTKPLMFCGIDNGVSGSIGFVSLDGFSEMIIMPTYSEFNYTKKKAKITRINHSHLINILAAKKRKFQLRIFLERPMVNPMRFKASVSAIRALENTLLALDYLQLSLMDYVDSREWQKVMLPSGCKGPELKKASMDIGCRKYPNYKTVILKRGDADGLLMAEWAKRTSR